MTSQCGEYALNAGQARLHARTSMHKPTCSGTRALTYTNMKYLLLLHCNIIRERAQMSHYTYIGCFVFPYNIQITSDALITCNNVFLEKQMLPQTSRNFCHFMEVEYSLPSLQEPAVVYILSQVKSLLQQYLTTRLRLLFSRRFQFIIYW
jgi:hypothetical protein